MLSEGEEVYLEFDVRNYFFEGPVPAFMWEQSGEVQYEELVHTMDDNLDKEVPEYEEYSVSSITV